MHVDMEKALELTIANHLKPMFANKESFDL